MIAIRNAGACMAIWSLLAIATLAEDDRTVRVFIFAGQSNMVGSDSKVADIGRFPPFAGSEKPQPDVRFSYCIGRENKLRSNGWVDLQPVNDVVGPELSFARSVTRRIDAPIAIIKCAAGGTHLGGDWNPEKPEGFKMYPLTLDLDQVVPRGTRSGRRLRIASKGSCGIRARTTCSMKSTWPTTERTWRISWPDGAAI